ncbi:hypothetical protein B0H19DRAFT_704037 [Mycena capillaripes]|nr:hypothetical protein B0H19DRAFT_704037 [Mycena capillaripes]
MQNLLSRGITFLTYCIADKISARRSIPSAGYSGLGYRPQNYKPDLSDYTAYITIRCRFLRSPRGRAALLYGGLISRLALATETSWNAVLRGPIASDSLFASGICLWDGHTTSAYWDDCLTENELDLICGVYHMATEQRDPNLFNGEQTTTLSWWPRPQSYAPSAMNVGWWTPIWESWYQKHLHRLESGLGAVASHTAWKHNLKLERKLPPYVEVLEKCSADILAVLRP